MLFFFIYSYNQLCINFYGVFADYEVPKGTSPPKTDDGRLEIIIPFMVVGTLAIVVIIIILILWRRKQKQRDAVDNGFAVIKKGSITMRDRLRAESLKSLDSRLLRLYDPNKLRQYPLDHVSYIKDIGEGFFGKVFQGRLLRLGRLLRKAKPNFLGACKIEDFPRTKLLFPGCLSLTKSWSVLCERKHQ